MQPHYSLKALIYTQNISICFMFIHVHIKGVTLKQNTMDAEKHRKKTHVCTGRKARLLPQIIHLILNFLYFQISHNSPTIVSVFFLTIIKTHNGRHVVAM